MHVMDCGVLLRIMIMLKFQKLRLSRGFRLTSFYMLYFLCEDLIPNCPYSSSKFIRSLRTNSCALTWKCKNQEKQLIR